MAGRESLSRRELQNLLKERGLKGANKKTSEILDILAESDALSGRPQQSARRHGTKVYEDGGRYTGELDVMGACDGNGMYTDAEGVQYRGQFRAGLKHGHGSETFPDGTIVKGLWVDDCPDNDTLTAAAVMMDRAQQRNEEAAAISFGGDTGIAVVVQMMIVVALALAFAHLCTVLFAATGQH